MCNNGDAEIYMRNKDGSATLFFYKKVKDSTNPRDIEFKDAIHSNLSYMDELNGRVSQMTILNYPPNYYSISRAIYSEEEEKPTEVICETNQDSINNTPTKEPDLDQVEDAWYKIKMAMKDNPEGFKKD
jgi:hypothetical protein